MVRHSPQCQQRLARALAENQQLQHIISRLREQAESREKVSSACCCLVVDVIMASFNMFAINQVNRISDLFHNKDRHFRIFTACRKHMILHISSLASACQVCPAHVKFVLRLSRLSSPCHVKCVLLMSSVCCSSQVCPVNVKFVISMASVSSKTQLEVSEDLGSQLTATAQRWASNEGRFENNLQLVDLARHCI